MTESGVTLQRGAERLGGLLPDRLRYGLERSVRGWFDARRLRRADVVVVSFGKSGRTWLRVMLSRLLCRHYGVPSDALIEFDNLHRLDQRIPRVFFTHDNYLRDYTGDGGSKRAYAGRRVVLLVRDPADVAMSQYFQWLHRMRPHKIRINGYPDPNDDQGPYAFLQGASGVQKVIGFLNEWAPVLDDVLMVRYEDLRAETAQELGRVAEYLGLDAAHSVIEDAVDHAAFENMRKREQNEAAGPSARLKAGDASNPDSFKARRGKVGGFHDYLEPEEAAAIEHMIGSELDPRFGYQTNTGTDGGHGTTQAAAGTPTVDGGI